MRANSGDTQAEFNTAEVLIDIQSHSDDFAYLYDRFAVLRLRADFAASDSQLQSDFGVFPATFFAESLVSICPSDSSIHHVAAAYVHFREGRLEDGLISAEKATQLNPVDSAAIVMVGNMLFVLRRFQEALAAFSLACRLYTDDNFDENVILSTPTIAMAHNNRGCVYSHQRRERGVPRFQRRLYLEQALSAFTQATLLYPDYGEAFNNQGTCYSILRQYDKAIHSYQQSLRINPINSACFENLGRVYIVKPEPEYDKAVAAFRESEKIGRGNKWAFRKHSRALREMGCFEEALDVVEESFRRRHRWHGEEKEYRFVDLDIKEKARVLWEMGREEEAASLMEMID